MEWQNVLLTVTFMLEKSILLMNIEIWWLHNSGNLYCTFVLVIFIFKFFI